MAQTMYASHSLNHRQVKFSCPKLSMMILHSTSCQAVQAKVHRIYTSKEQSQAMFMFQLTCFKT